MLTVILEATGLSLGQFRMAVKRGNLALPDVVSAGSGRTTMYSLSDFIEILAYAEISRLGLPYKISESSLKGGQTYSFIIANLVMRHINAICEEKKSLQLGIFQWNNDFNSQYIDTFDFNFESIKNHAFVVFNFSSMADATWKLYQENKSLFV